MSEQTEHEALFALLARMEGRYPALAFVKHTPNGEKRDKATAAKLKRMGVRAGVWDIEFLAPNALPVSGFNEGFFDGLAIEIKVGGNTLSPDQRRWEEHYRANGWYTVVCYTWTVAARLLVRWVGGNPEEIEGL